MSSYQDALNSSSYSYNIASKISELVKSNVVPTQEEIILITDFYVRSKSYISYLYHFPFTTAFRTLLTDRPFFELVFSNPFFLSHYFDDSSDQTERNKVLQFISLLPKLDYDSIVYKLSPAEIIENNIIPFRNFYFSFSCIGTINTIVSKINSYSGPSDALNSYFLNTMRVLSKSRICPLKYTTSPISSFFSIIPAEILDSAYAILKDSSYKVFFLSNKNISQEIRISCLKKYCELKRVFPKIAVLFPDDLRKLSSEELFNFLYKLTYNISDRSQMSDAFLSLDLSLDEVKSRLLPLCKNNKYKPSDISVVISKFNKYLNILRRNATYQSTLNTITSDIDSLILYYLKSSSLDAHIPTVKYLFSLSSINGEAEAEQAIHHLEKLFSKDISIIIQNLKELK